MTPAEIDAIVAHIESLRPPAPEPAPRIAPARKMTRREADACGMN